MHWYRTIKLKRLEVKGVDILYFIVDREIFRQMGTFLWTLRRNSLLRIKFSCKNTQLLTSLRQFIYNRSQNLTRGDLRLRF